MARYPQGVCPAMWGAKASLAGGAMAWAATQASGPAAMPSVFARAVALSEASSAPAMAAWSLAALEAALGKGSLVAQSELAGVASRSRASEPRGK